MNRFTVENTTETTTDALMRNAMFRVYFLLAAALAATSIAAFIFTNAVDVENSIFRNEFALIGVITIQICLVYVFDQLESGFTNVFMLVSLGLFAIFEGIYLSTIFLYIDVGTLKTALIGAMAMFVVMGIYGSRTSTNLISHGSLVYTGLIGLVISLFVSFLLQSGFLIFLISAGLIIVFNILIAFNTQKIQEDTADALRYGDNIAIDSIAIRGALDLYLNFFGLFHALMLFFKHKDVDPPFP